MQEAGGAGPGRALLSPTWGACEDPQGQSWSPGGVCAQRPCGLSRNTEARGALLSPLPPLHAGTGPPSPPRPPGAAPRPPARPPTPGQRVRGPSVLAWRRGEGGAGGGGLPTLPSEGPGVICQRGSDRVWLH
ncbi:Hypothetical predicted protein [Lynx pardinus]|uniref:Uncharacterized protein n=1 Tax=Lynx pardinus TaxID=191816 RepID=A0A485P6E3_LYNPA|nr:Hypothetical predicted protein [Lynx pardinus]